MSTSFSHTPWYASKKSQAAAALHHDFSVLENQQRGRIDAICDYRNLYRNKRYAGLEPWNYQSVASDVMAPENILRPLVDTLTAKLIRNRPRVSAATIGGSLEARTRARHLSLFWDGIWAQNRVHACLGKYVREGLVTGDGVWLVRKEFSADRDKGRVVVELVSVSEFFVDPVEAFYGDPRTLYRRRYIDRRWLAGKFPEFAKAIAAAPKATDVEAAVLGPSVDLVQVLESWHLPSMEGAEDGAYLLSVGDTALRSADWPYPDFPIVRFSPTPPMQDSGYWGTGLVESMAEAQSALSDTAGTILESQRLLGKPWVLVEENAEVNVKHLQNKTGVVVKYRGNPPQFHTADPVSRQMYGDVQVRRDRMQEDSGVSRMSMTSNKPAGFDPSGRAIQEMADVETERFLELGRALEESMLQLAKWTTRVAKELDEELDGGFKMVARDGREALELNWRDVDLDEDAFVMHVEATAWQGRSLPGRIADVERLANTGAITDPVIFGMLIDHPDITAYLEEKGSPVRIVEMMAEVMLTTDEFIPPEPYMDLKAALPQMQALYLAEKTKKKGEDSAGLGRLRRWMDKAAAMLQPPPQAQPTPSTTAAEIPPEAAAAGEAAPTPEPAPPPAPLA